MSHGPYNFNILGSPLQLGFYHTTSYVFFLGSPFGDSNSATLHGLCSSLEQWCKNSWPLNLVCFMPTKPAPLGQCCQILMPVQGGVWPPSWMTAASASVFPRQLLLRSRDPLCGSLSVSVKARSFPMSLYFHKNAFSLAFATWSVAFRASFYYLTKDNKVSLHNYRYSVICTIIT